MALKRGGRHSKAVTEQILGQRGGLVGDLMGNAFQNQLGALSNQQSALTQQMLLDAQRSQMLAMRDHQLDALRYANHRHYLMRPEGEVILETTPSGLTRKRYEGDELTFHERLQYEVNQWLKPVRR